MQYGIGEVDDVRMEELVEQTMKEEKNVRKYFESSYNQKVTELFKTTFTIKNKDISFEEFSDLVQKKQKPGLLSGLKNLMKRE